MLKALKLNEATLSTLLGALVVIVIGVLIFNYFSRSVDEGLSPEEMIEEEISEELVGGEGEIFVPKDLPTKHTVVSGESLWKIAERYYGTGYNWVDIAKENSLANPSHIYEGQELAIPKTEPKILAKLPETEDTSEKGGIASDKYTVQRSDNLWTIAVRTYGDGYRWVEIAQANNLANPDLIHAGNEFVLPR